ncbi:MAG: PilZ domain-containing protein [Myxococcales bacterium]|nr:PilZ domain-containing protein [Myxococcales bacterium]
MEHAPEPDSSTSSGLRAARRRSWRTPVSLRFRGATVELESVDISATGMFVAADVYLSVGALVFCSLQLPDGGRLDASARVVRDVAAPHAAQRAGMGIAFEGLPLFDARRIDRALQRMPRSVNARLAASA